MGSRPRELLHQQCRTRRAGTPRHLGHQERPDLLLGLDRVQEQTQHGLRNDHRQHQSAQGQGLWPAFWLKGADEDTTAWPQSGEIDVLELPSTTTTVYSTLHGPIAGTTATQQAQIVSNLPDLSTGYHSFWVRHLVDEITFGVDGTTLGTLTPASLAPGSTWVYNRPMFAILNLAVGGPWAGAPNGSTRFPAKMLVDSVQWIPA